MSTQLITIVSNWHNFNYIPIGRTNQEKVSRMWWNSDVTTIHDALLQKHVLPKLDEYVYLCRASQKPENMKPTNE